MPSRLVERSPLLALLAVAVGAYGCKDGAAAAPPLLDEAWCDISAIPCLVATQGSDGSPITCSVLGSDSVPASAPWGDRICFDSTSTTPSAACTALCNPGPHSYLNPAVYASGAGCTASVDTNPAYHPELNAQSYRAHACTGETNGESAGLSTTGTNSVLLSGAATASYGVATQSVALTGGRFDFTAPNVDCMGLESACSTQVNQIELDLADFSVGALSMTGLEVASDGLFETASGQLLAPQPPVAPDPTFLFDMPPGLVFDATAGIRLNGADAPGLVLNAEQESQGILVPSTGLIGFQFSLAHARRATLHVEGQRDHQPSDRRTADHHGAGDAHRRCGCRVFRERDIWRHGILSGRARSPPRLRRRRRSGCREPQRVRDSHQRQSCSDHRRDRRAGRHEQCIGNADRHVTERRLPVNGDCFER